MAWFDFWASARNGALSNYPYMGTDGTYIYIATSLSATTCYKYNGIAWTSVSKTFSTLTRATSYSGMNPLPTSAASDANYYVNITSGNFQGTWAWCQWDTHDGDYDWSALKRWLPGTAASGVTIKDGENNFSITTTSTGIATTTDTCSTLDGYWEDEGDYPLIYVNNSKVNGDIGENLYELGLSKTYTTANGSYDVTGWSYVSAPSSATSAPDAKYRFFVSTHVTHNIVYVKIDNQWKQGTVYVKINNSWKMADNVFIKQSSTWK